MGYDVHITRADDWFDSGLSPISLEEWLGYVGTDIEMRLDRLAVATVQGEPAVAYESEGLAVWTTWSGHQEDGNKAWFDHRDGRVVVKNPDDEMLRKIKMVASALGAKVLGDDGEEY